MDVSTIKVSWEEIISAEYVSENAVDMLTADQGLFIKLESVDGKTGSEIISIIRSKIGRQLVDQAAAKLRRYDQLALIQKNFRPIILINICLFVTIGVAGRFIDKKGHGPFDNIPENASEQQIKTTLGKPLRKVSGKTYFDAAIGNLSKGVKKTKQPETDMIKGITGLVIVGQRELLEQDNAIVLTYSYHGDDYFYLLIDNKYNKKLMATQLPKIEVKK